jgi:phosphohistidine phosphatase
MSMKRNLFIVRHAKSTWDYKNVSDIDRPLKLSGIQSAYEMARRLKINRTVPEYLITSPANRAIHTANIFMNVFELPYDRFKVEAQFYSQGTEEILSIIKSMPSAWKKVMIFGHNPDFSELVRYFAKQQILELPTCGIINLTFECDEWADINKDNLIAESFDFPKME